MKKKEILQKKLVKFNHDIFNYPFDYKLLTRNLNNSIENLNTLKSKKKIKLYILSGSTISNISDQIKLFASNFGIELKIKIGAYNKYYEGINFKNQIILSKNLNLEEASRNLYKSLHLLDNMNVDLILTSLLPNHDIGKSINDRIIKASKKNEF